MNLEMMEVLLFCIFILALIYIYLTWSFNYFKKMGITGPTPWPIFGNSLDLIKMEMHRIDIERARKYGDLYGIYDGLNPALVTADLNMIRAITQKDFNHFTDRRTVDLSKVAPVLNQTLTNLTGDKWRAARNVVSPSFTTGKMKQLFIVMMECAKEFSKNCSKYADERKVLDMKQTFGGVSMDTIARCGFGIHINSLDNPDEPFVVHSRKMVMVASRWVLVVFVAIPWVLSFLPTPQSLKDTFKFFSDAAQSIVSMRENDDQKRNDFLQHLLDARKSDDVVVDSESDPDDGSATKVYSAKKVLTDDMITAQTMQMLVAGFETTSMTLAYISYNLALNPDCQEKLINEIHDVLETREITYEDLSESSMPYLEMVIAETLRMYPPAARIERKCTKEYQYENIRIKEGMMVMIPAYVIQHDERYYPDPEKFIPERFSVENRSTRSIYTYMPFGLGPRNCVGMRFALLEVKAILVTVLREFRFTTCTETEVPLKFEFAFLLNAMVKLQLERQSK